MLRQLPETINSFSHSSQMTVSSLVREMKLDKLDFGNLVTKLSSTRLNTSYSPSVFEQFSLINREFFIDMFRDADVRMKTYYSTANMIGAMLSTMTDVLFSEIEKVEKDLDLMSTFINNYEFLSGKDDLYNVNYVEKFNSSMNDYKFDGYSFTLTDRDNKPFDENGNGFVDSKTGIFKIGNNVIFKNILNFVDDVKIETNYSNYISTDTGFYNCLNEDNSDSWNVTIKSPVILNTEPSNISRYISYDQSYITGARSMVEISLSAPQLIDCIYVTPGHGNGLQLLQVVLFNDRRNDTTYISNQENDQESQTISSDDRYATVLLSAPKILDSTTEINFDIKYVDKIILILNQPVYSKNENIVSTTELTGRALHTIARQIVDSKKQNQDIVQDMVYNLFLKNNSIKEVFKNKYFNESYYSFKYPYIKNNFLNKDYRKKYTKENISFDSLEKSSSTILTNVFENFLIHSIRDVGEYYSDTVYVESNTQSRSIYSFKNPGFLPEKNTNNINSTRTQSISTETVSRSNNKILKDLLNVEKNDQYEYSFSIKSIDLGLVSSEAKQDKACFVSKKIPLNGHPVAVKCLIEEQNGKVNLDLYDYDLKNPVSYELSISNIDSPIGEFDWTPIVAYGDTHIESEVLFFDYTLYSAKTRFEFIKETIKVYKDGYLINPSEYTIKEQEIIINNLDKNSKYVCQYDINSRLYNFDNIDLIKSGLIKESSSPYADSDGLGQKFSSTNYLAKITLKNVPYVKDEYTKNATYNPTFGTIFDDQYQGYNPIKILMSDGSYAINLTNYTDSKYFPSFSNSSGYYFIQNGKEIVFNQIVTDPFVVYYDYTNNSLRFRVILRKNIPSIEYTGSIDSVLLKAKTKLGQSDIYSNTLSKALIRN